MKVEKKELAEVYVFKIFQSLQSNKSVCISIALYFVHVLPYRIPYVKFERLFGCADPVWSNRLKQLQKLGLRRSRRNSSLRLPRLDLGLLYPI